MSGPAHRAEADRYAGMAAGAGDPATVAVLTALGQPHATLALAAATTLHEEYADIRGWQDVTGQD